MGQHVALTAPAGKQATFKTVRGLWVITHRNSGLSAGSLRCTKERARSIARQWDHRFGCIDPTDARSWPWAKAWAELVRSINNPEPLPFIDDGCNTDTACELAARAGLPIDQAGGGRRIWWRGQFWHAPTNAELDWWTFDSVCETPDGRTVEPDAPDSWLSLLGLV
jgi:hypothetical protein